MVLLAPNAKDTRQFNSNKYQPKNNKIISEQLVFMRIIVLSLQIFASVNMKLI